MNDKPTCPYCGGGETRRVSTMRNVFSCKPCGRSWKEDGRITVDTNRIRALEAALTKAEALANTATNLYEITDGFLQEVWTKLGGDANGYRPNAVPALADAAMKQIPTTTMATTGGKSAAPPERND